MSPSWNKVYCFVLLRKKGKGDLTQLFVEDWYDWHNNVIIKY